MNKRKWKKPLNLFLSFVITVSLIIPVHSSAATAAVVADDLLISEYIEGSSFNKAIELFNGTGTAVDLSDYTLELYANGAATAGNRLALSGTLENGATYVISHSSADQEIKAVSDLEHSSVINFNGNDPVVLRKSGEVVDSIGQVGRSDDYMKDVTLVRKPNITTGDKIIDDPFDPSVEWLSLPQDDVSNLGRHTFGAEDPDEEPEQPAILSIADARQRSLGSTVTVKGVVTAKLKNTISIQDETGGIAVRPTSLNAAVGDEMTVTGKLGDYRGLLQLDSAVIVNKIENVGTPAPLEVEGNELNEDLESQLVVVKNVQLTEVDDGSAWANFTATDGTGEFLVRDENNHLGLMKGNTYESITGIVQQYNQNYQILPRSIADIVEDSSVIQPVVASPGSGTFVNGTTVALTTSTKDATIFYTLDGSNPIENGIEYTSPLDIQEDTTLKAVIKTVDGQWGEVQTFQYNITDALRIHDIQGAGHVSEYDRQTVERIEGVVTYSFFLNGSNYYHIQTPDDQMDDDPATSEAIVLYSGNKEWPIEVGDLVSVTGTVSEYAIDGYNDRQETDLKMTQINVRDDRGGNVDVIEKNVPLPKPILIDESNLPTEHIDSDHLQVFNPDVDAIDFWESLEAMRVQVGNVKAVAPQEHGDLVTVLESAPTDTIHGGVLYEEDDQNAHRIHFRLEPNGPARNFEVATGDRFNGPITGVVGYSYQNYKIYTSLAEMEDAFERGETEPETTSIVKDPRKLTVASYNLENFSNNISQTSNDKAQRLARAFVADMKNPDIVGVTEVQDNNGTLAGDSDASESYQRLIAEIKKAGGVEYDYVNINPINNQDGGAPDANIRVGFLYNPERVSLVDGIPHGDATTAVGFENGKLTLNPGRIDPTNPAFNSSRKPLAAQFRFNGEDVIVIANHWNSKSGDTPLFGAIQPPEYKSEVQRQQIAEIVYNFVHDIKEKDPQANVISLGDFNDYPFSKSLKIHEGDLMTNMINQVPAAERYTYVYQGNSQVLDHILVSNHLAAKTEVDILHINADFTDMAGRASDHDPVMIQVDLAGDMVEAEKTYHLVAFKTNKLTISSERVALTLAASSEIKEAIYLHSQYAELKGASLKETTIIVQPAEPNAILDFNGSEVKQVMIDGTNVKEIRGAEQIIDHIQYKNGATPEAIKFTDSKGELISSPSLPEAAYYQAAFGKTGAELKSTLHNIINDHTMLPYSTVWEALKETDEDPNNPEHVILFYSGISRAKSSNGGNVGQWNREHVWAQSHGNFGTSMGPGTDIHHLRPTDVQVNSARGNLDFDYGGSPVKNCDDCLRTSQSWEPPDRVKGDVARMLFYMAVRYESDDRVDLELNDSLNNGSTPYHGKLSVLLQWHEQDPVDDYERNRNDVIYEKWQHNRNPFIDYPEWAEDIWGEI
ncbi:endonuclease [Robertmurraya sp. DFI.2.37]|nr:endonuclease [Robertmurraya sp. DFI.2.37]MDF1510245.1 endonuclease [Robertmurraya sp. DFI.2.37]